MDGKQIRLNRLLRNGKMFCVPIDHGVTNGPVGKLKSFHKLVLDIVDSGVTSIVVHRGMIRLLPEMRNTGIIVHLSASTDMYNEVKKILVCSVEDALRNGADAVSVHINVGNSYEKEMLSDLSKVAIQCDYYGIPLVAMMYVRDDNNINSTQKDKIIHAVRIAAELGADIAKITHMHNMEDLKEIVDTAPIPIIVAGGDKYSCACKLYDITQSIMKQNVLGVSYGRNIFESSDTKSTLEKISSIIFGQV